MNHFFFHLRSYFKPNRLQLVTTIKQNPDHATNAPEGVQISGETLSPLERYYHSHIDPYHVYPVPKYEDFDLGKYPNLRFYSSDSFITLALSSS